MQKDTSNKHLIIHAETGEIVREVDFDTCYIRSHTQDEAYRKKLKATEFGRSHAFTFTNMEAIKEVIEQLDDSECGYLLYLQCFIDFDGKLVQGNRDKTPMTKQDVQETLGISRPVFTKFWKSMTDNGIIYELEGKYFINRRFHFKGTSDNSKVIRSFTTKVRELYTQKNAKDLGFIYKLLPFVHYETNTICHNPFEAEPQRIMKMSQQDIADVTGTDRITVNRKMKRLTLGDEYLFAEVNVGKTKCYMLNPFVFYRKNGKPDATLQTIFAIKGKKK
jgi:CRP-like cAMP-binding protein